MERALERLARQLLSFDEASLMALWEKYYERVQHFEPTRRWEESVLVLNLIQAVHWKNLLFNTKWAEEKSLQPGQEEADPRKAGDAEEPAPEAQDRSRESQDKGKVIRFPHADGDAGDED